MNEPTIPPRVAAQLRVIIRRAKGVSTPTNMRFVWTGIGRGLVTFGRDESLVVIGRDADLVHRAERGSDGRDPDEDRDLILRRMFGY
jgi:hypothetical protein